MGEFVIALDFDGTVVDHSFPYIGQPNPMALEWLRIYQKRGVKIILWTVRSYNHHNWTTGESVGDLLTPAVKYLEGNGIQLWGINERPGQKNWSESQKVHADIFIDDLGAMIPLVQYVGFERPCVDWNKVGPLVYDKIREVI